MTRSAGYFRFLGHTHPSKYGMDANIPGIGPWPMGTVKGVDPDTAEWLRATGTFEEVESSAQDARPIAQLLAQKKTLRRKPQRRTRPASR